MIFIYLFFSHLLGDFIFQTYSLVKYKSKSSFGLILHSLIHFFLNISVLVLLTNIEFFTAFYVSLIISVTHLFIDYAKLEYEKKYKSRVKPFFVDQSLHLLVLIFVSLYLCMQKAVNLFIAPDIIVLLIALILVSKVIEVIKYIKKLEKNKKEIFRVNYQDMAKRTALIVIIFLIYFLIKGI